MEGFRRISELSHVSWGGSNVIRTLTESAGIFVFSYSPTHKSLVTWSSNAPAVLGTKDANIARDANLFLRHVHPDDRFLLMTDLEHALKGDGDYRATYRWIRPDNNEVRWLHCRGALVKYDSEELFEGIVIDMSDEFTGSVGKLAGPDSVTTILAALPVMVFTLDRDLRLLRINRPPEYPAFDFGDPEFKVELFRIGHPLMECFSDTGQKSHYQALFTQVLGGALPFHRSRIFTGDTVQSLGLAPLAEHGVIEGILCTVSDLSETISLERQLADLQKTEGLRLLAAGVAHHFNNSLQGIIGQATVINTHPDKKELVVQASQAIIEAVNKTSNLSRQLFVFEENQRGSPVPVDVNLALMAATTKIDNLFSSGFKIAVIFGNPPAVLARHEELVEAIEAVLRNSIESMIASGKTQGALAVTTFEVSLQELEVGDLKAGFYAKVVISDSGPGMADEAKRRCFEPFFTTKERDPHTGLSHKPAGLGLSKAFTIVREFKGAITADSDPGVGTTISIYLPLADGTLENSVKSLFEVNRANPPEILIVDDDLMVLKTMSAIMRDLGFNCAVADNSTRALSIVRTCGKALRLVLLDAVMPGADGASVLRRIKKVNKDLKVIGFSGASKNETQPLLDAGAMLLIRKPVDPMTLKDVVKRALNAKQAA